MTPAATAALTPSATANLALGLTTEEVRSRLEKSGPNAMPDTSEHPLLRRLEIA